MESLKFQNDFISEELLDEFKFMNHEYKKSAIIKIGWMDRRCRLFHHWLEGSKNQNRNFIGDLYPIQQEDFDYAPDPTCQNHPRF